MFKKKLGFIFLITIALSAGAQYPPFTMGQAYNWQVGDTLIYQPVYWNYDGWSSNQSSDTLANIGFSVISKTAFTDSIVYALGYFDGSTKSVTISNLDSSVLAFGNFPQIKVDAGCFDATLPGDSFIASSNGLYSDTIYNQSNFLNRPVLYAYYLPLAYPYQPSGWAYAVCSIAEGVGVVSYMATVQTDFGNQSTNHVLGCSYSLVYYSSGNLRWLSNTQVPAVQFDVQVFPNPTTGNLSVMQSHAQDMIESIIVYDISDRQVSAYYTNGYQPLISLSLSNMANGMYLISLLNKNGQLLYRQKVFKQ